MGDPTPEPSEAELHWVRETMRLGKLVSDLQRRLSRVGLKAKRLHRENRELRAAMNRAGRNV